MKNIQITSYFKGLALLLVFVSLGFSGIQKAQASHMAGGEITYTCIGQDSFLITLKVFRYCNGAGFNSNSITVSPTSTCGGSASVQLTRLTGPLATNAWDISQICSSQQSNCASGSTTGYEEYIYQGIFVANPRCNCWTIGYSPPCCRNSLGNASASTVYFDTELCNTVDSCNNSPTFGTSAIHYVCAGFPVSYNMGATDPDGDSLSYKFICPRTNATTCITWTGAASTNSPFPGITLDTLTGQIRFTPTVTGSFVMAVEVTEWDANGNKKGTTMRDIQFRVETCSNTPPYDTLGITNYTGVGYVNYANNLIEVCLGDSFSFDLTIWDYYGYREDTLDTLLIKSNVQSILPGSSFNINAIDDSVHVVTIGWRATQTGSLTNVFFVQTSDDACPVPGFTTSSYTVKVIPSTESGYTSNHSPGCGPIDVSFTNNSVNAVSYFWDFGDTSTSTAPNPSHTYENKTLFIEIYDTKLIAIAANGCTDTSSQAITVYPEPIFTFTANPDSGCSPLRVTFPSVIGAVTYAWDFDDGSSGTGPTPTHTFGNGTTNNVNYNVRLIARSSFGCIDTNYQNVIVHPNPIADFTLSDSVGCQPLPISITNNSSGAINYFWDFGNGDTSMSSANVFNYSYSHPMPNPTNNNLRLIVETDRQCRDTLEQNVIVYPEVTANFIKSDSAGCSPLRVNFTNLSNNAQNFSWDFQDGSTSAAQNPIHTFINSGTTSQLRDVLLVSSSVYGCVDSSSKVIVINPLPVADFSLSDTASCQPLVESITNNTTGAIKYEWFYGNGDTSNTSNSNFNYTYTHFSIVPVNYNFRLIATTNLGCKDTASQNIRVFPQILTNFLTSDTIGCTPLTTRFTNFSTGSQFFNWDFGDGNSSVNGTVSHTYQNTSTVNRTYTAELVTSSVYGCTDTARQNIVVHPKPISSFNPSTLSGCQPLTVDFNNNSVIATQNFWEFGDGSSSTSAAALVSHTYSNTGTSSQFRNVRLIVVSQFGCEDTSFQTIEVYPLVESNFDINDTSGCHPFTANFTSLSTNAQLYAWDFGDGASDVIANPTHIYQNTTTANVSYTVSLIVTSPEGCPDTVDQQITVYPQPVAAFTATPVNQKFPNATVSFNNLSNPGTWSYDWEFGDGATETLQVPNDYTYQTWGTFTLTLVVRSANCSDTAQQIVVIDPPRAVVAFVGNGEGCKPLTVEFENQSEYGQSYIWNFGDGGVSTLETPAPYTYYNAGTYSINLSVLGPDGDLVTMVKVDSVVVHEVSEAYFDLAPSEVVVPTQPVNFYNLSQNADQYVWDFGDGTTSTEEDPEHYYQEPGWYTVRLLTDNEFGCPDSFVIDEAVFADNKGSIEFPTAFIPDPSGPNGGSYDPNSFRNDIFFPVFEGVIEYHLMIFNRWGEIIFETKEIGRGWDGYHQLTGQILQQDVYVWRANVTFANQQTQELAGEVTLLR